MKISFWDILTGILMFAGFGVVLVFANIFIDPYTILNPFPPPTLQPTLRVPTATPTLRVLPAIWTVTPTGTLQTTTLQPSTTAQPSRTAFVLPTRTATNTTAPTFTPTGSKTITPARTNTPVGYKTSTPTRTKTPTGSAGGFAITSVQNVDASPDNWTGICPKSFSMTASIYYTGDGTITYYWVRSSDNAHLSAGSFDTDGTSPDTFTATLTSGTPGFVNTSTYSLYIDNPNHQQFNGVDIPMVCTGLTFTSSVTASVAENNTTVTTVTTSPTGSTFSITSGADSAKFDINSSTGALTFKVAPNYESPDDVGTDHVYNVTVHAVNGSLTADQAITVTVTNANDNPPVITSDGGLATATKSVPENSTAVTTVTATDLDNLGSLTYLITGGADSAKFDINSSTGVLTFKVAPNYESPDDVGTDHVYDVIVGASDGTFSDTQAIAVTVTDANDAPVITGGATASYSFAENSTAAVATVAATDEDLPAQTLTFSISGGADAALFAIDGASGVLSFLAPPDFENPVGGDNTYNVTVQVADNGSPVKTATQAITVTVSNVDEAPAITKVFGTSPITVTTGISTLTITIANTSPNAVSLTDVAFTDTFPTGMEVAATPNVTTSGCGSPTFAPVATNTSLTFSAGSIAAAGTCTVSVDVTGTTVGSKDNTTSAVTSHEADEGAAASATLVVN